MDTEEYPLTAEAGRELFEDDERRFAELVELALRGCESLRA